MAINKQLKGKLKQNIEEDEEKSVTLRQTNKQMKTQNK